jgi:carboxyl-terminal processing protease
MWKTVKWSSAGLAVALIIVMAGVTGYAIGDNGRASEITARPSQDSTGFGVLDEISRILETDFVNPAALDPKVQRRGAIDGLIASLGDPHTTYISPDDYGLGVDIISGAFQGIGAQVDKDPATGEIVIVAPFRNSPAEKVGILPGDVLVSVDGESAKGWTVQQAVQRIRGPEGSQVKISVRRTAGTDVQEKEFTITRATIQIPTVFPQAIKGKDGNSVNDLAYLEIQQFTDQTVDDLKRELRRIEDGGYKGLILDLRRNPGGGLDATVSVADMFINDGLILTQIDRNGKETVYNATAGGEFLDLPVVVLVGPGSASGSEVLSAALRDHGRATLIGEKTFGKGSVNHLRELSDGGALYVTIARWRTPKGELIEGVGLQPDIPITPTTEDVDAKRDVQLFAAIDFLQHGGTQAQAQ